LGVFLWRGWFACCVFSRCIFGAGGFCAANFCCLLLLFIVRAVFFYSEVITSLFRHADAIPVVSCFRGVYMHRRSRALWYIVFDFLTFCIIFWKFGGYP
jgi:hypothetical protein